MARVFTIAPSRGFAEALALGVIAQLDLTHDPLALAGVTIYLPTRRAARTLEEAFVAALGGAVLLPTIRPLGDADEEDLSFDPQANDLDLPPAIDPLRQRLLLAAMVQRWSAQRGRPIAAAESVALAKGLADFLHEVQTAGADLARLDDLAPAHLAHHWAEVRDFLALLREYWPSILEAEKSIDPAARRNLALAAVRLRLETEPPKGLIVAAGSTGSIPATAALLATIARLPNGAVVLPGLDRTLDPEAWGAIDEGHPQFGLKQLLATIGIDREAVRDWPGSVRDTPRTELLREALRPAPATDAWQALAAEGSARLAPACMGLSLLEAANPAEEALAIALLLRQTLDTPQQRAALVTPDRALARRVAAELTRWGISIDDSAGRPLPLTRAGEFLLLLAEAASAAFTPVALLSLLKHPLAAGGMEPSEFRRAVRQLELRLLRGPSTKPGLADLLGRSAGDPTLAGFVARLHDVLHQFERVYNNGDTDLGALLSAHIAAAEALTASDEVDGAERLWSGEDGCAAAALLERLRLSATGLPKQNAAAWPVLLRALFDEETVRPAFGSHPRLAILGPLEARLQQFDLVILGGLNEGTWPRAATNDSWLSRPMRKALGLDAPERRIGRAAHDFMTLADAPCVVLSRALKADGSPTVASRWLQRLTQLLRGLGLECDDRQDILAIARQLDRPQQSAPPLKRPRPTPPIKARPRTLSVTEIETWLRDPYAIYAKHVLRLRPLDPLQAIFGPLERGSAIHAALEHFSHEFPDIVPEGAELRLIELAEVEFDRIRLPPAVRALWKPRVIQAARWFVEQERARRTLVLRTHVEIKGEMHIAAPAGVFTLRGKADRIDELRAGGAGIVDYKSGEPPSDKQVKTLLSPQLPLEAAILASGGFAAAGPIPPAELVYIRFSGGAEPGEWKTIKADAAALASEAQAKLAARVAAFDNPHTAYPPRLMPFMTGSAGDYDHLARVREWSSSAWESEE